MLIPSTDQLVDIEGRLQTRQWDDDAGKGHCQADPENAIPHNASSHRRLAERVRAVVRPFWQQPMAATLAD